MARIRIRSLMATCAVACLALGSLRAYPEATILILLSMNLIVLLLMPLAPVFVLNHPGFRSRVLAGRRPTGRDWCYAWLAVGGLALLLFSIAFMLIFCFLARVMGDPHVACRAVDLAQAGSFG